MVFVPIGSDLPLPPSFLILLKNNLILKTYLADMSCLEDWKEHQQDKFSRSISGEHLHLS